MSHSTLFRLSGLAGVCCAALLLINTARLEPVYVAALIVAAAGIAALGMTLARRAAAGTVAATS